MTIRLLWSIEFGLHFLTWRCWRKIGKCGKVILLNEDRFVQDQDAMDKSFFKLETFHAIKDAANQDCYTT